MAWVGCRACGKTIQQNAEACPHCGWTPGSPVHPAYPAHHYVEHSLMQDMTDVQRVLFQQQMTSVRKDTGAGVLLALFLGGLGAHHFYMGNYLVGIIYALFSWTFIPLIVAVIEAFIMPARVRAFNNARAMEIATQIRALSR